MRPPRPHLTGAANKPQMKHSPAGLNPFFSQFLSARPVSTLAPHQLTRHHLSFASNFTTSNSQSAQATSRHAQNRTRRFDPGRKLHAEASARPTARSIPALGNRLFGVHALACSPLRIRPDPSPPPGPLFGRYHSTPGQRKSRDRTRIALLSDPTLPRPH